MVYFLQSWGFQDYKHTHLQKQVILFAGTIMNVVDSAGMAYHTNVLEPTRRPLTEALKKVSV